MASDIKINITNSTLQPAHLASLLTCMPHHRGGWFVGGCQPAATAQAPKISLQMSTQAISLSVEGRTSAGRPQMEISVRGTSSTGHGMRCPCSGIAASAVMPKALCSPEPTGVYNHCSKFERLIAQAGHASRLWLSLGRTNHQMHWPGTCSIATMSFCSVNSPSLEVLRKKSHAQAGSSAVDALFRDRMAQRAQ